MYHATISWWMEPESAEVRTHSNHNPGRASTMTPHVLQHSDLLVCHTDQFKACVSNVGEVVNIIQFSANHITSISLQVKSDWLIYKCSTSNTSK